LHSPRRNRKGHRERGKASSPYLSPHENSSNKTLSALPGRHGVREGVTSHPTKDSLSLLPSLTQPLSSEQSSCCIPSPGRRSTDAGVGDQGASSACGRAMAFPRVCASVALLVVAFSCLMPASGQCTRLTGRHILSGLKRLVLAGSDVRPVLIFLPSSQADHHHPWRRLFLV
jgi:hypothetical protein